MGSGAAGTCCVAASEGDCVSSGSHNDRFHGLELVPGWLRVSLCEDVAHISAIWPFRKWAAMLRVAYVPPCVGRRSRPVSVVWVMGPVGLRMSRHTQAVKSVMTQWLSAAMPPATYALACVAARIYFGGLGAGCLSRRLRMSWHAYLSGYVMSSARRRAHQRSTPPRRSCRTVTESPVRSAENKAVQNSAGYDCCHPHRPRTCHRA